MNRAVVYDATNHRVVVKANLTAQRWYPTALPLPDGSVWVPGGTWAQKPNGTVRAPRGGGGARRQADGCSRRRDGRCLAINASLHAAVPHGWPDVSRQRHYIRSPRPCLTPLAAALCASHRSGPRPRAQISSTMRTTQSPRRR